MKILTAIIATGAAAMLAGCATKTPNQNIGIQNIFHEDSKSFVVSGGTGVNAQLRPETVNKSAGPQTQTPTGAVTASASDQAIVTGTSIGSSRATDAAASVAQVVAKQAQTGASGATTTQDGKQEATNGASIPIAVTGQGNADAKVNPPAKPAE